MKRFAGLLIVFCVVLIQGVMVAAQEVSLQGLSTQLTGTWIGVLEGKEPTRTVQIQEIHKVETLERVPFEGKAIYGITGKRMDPVSIAIAFNDGKAQVSLLSPAKSRILLTMTNAMRMDGTFTAVGKTERNFRWWKTGLREPLDENLAGLVGTWKGQWRNGLEAQLRVDYLDAMAASVTYVWGNLPDASIIAGWSRLNGKVVGGKTLEFGSGRPRFHRYTVSEFFGRKRFDGYCDPCPMRDGTNNSVVWSRTDSFPVEE